MSGRAMREAVIDLAALRANVAALTTAGVGPLVDLSGDAYGHGALRVAQAVLDAGARGVAVGDSRERESLAVAGIDCSLLQASETAADDTAALYGVGDESAWPKTIPVMRVSAGVISIKTIDAGEPVSYGYTWRAPERTTLALVPLGYADGISRTASNRGRMWLAGAMRDIVGRVAMDVSVLRLGADRAELGDEAVLFGDPLVGASAAAWGAESSGDPEFPALSVTAGIGARVTRSWTT